MSYVDFAKSITYTDDFEKTIKLFFDEIMALYNLIGIKPVNISTIHEEPSSIKFALLANSEEEAKLLYKLTKDKIISIYNHNYIAELELMDCSLILTLGEAASG